MPESFVEGRVALITGGATGIGRATAYALAEAGARAVIINYSRSADEARTTVDHLTELGVHSLGIQADVADPDQAQSLIHDTIKIFGGIDVLVNNAARTRAVPFADLDSVLDTDWSDTLGLNVIGAFNCIRAARRALIEANGSVVNIATASAERAAGTSIPYSVSKAALVQLTRCLSVALAPSVRVNAISPGAVDSRWLTDILGTEAARAQREQELPRIPLGRIATPGDIARSVVGIIDSRYTTGQNLIVDGGRAVTY